MTIQLWLMYLTLVFVATATPGPAVLMFYALLAHKARTWLLKPLRAKAVARTSGSIFIGFGILLAASSNR
jgi:threonine/homoserine/homoserine lactone efflux protein